MTRTADPSPPPFEEWVDYCFTRGKADADWKGEGSRDEQDERFDRYLWIDRRLLIGYLIRLAEDPGFIAKRYSDEQIRDAISLLFSGAHPGVPQHLMDDDPEHPPRPRCASDDEARLMRAISTVYTDLFDRVCGRRGTDPDAEITTGIDNTVYLLWDTDYIEGPLLFPDWRPHLIEPSFDVIHTAMFDCRTAACRQSGLYAIAEIVGSHTCGDDGDPMIVQRLQEMADSFLALPGIPEWLRECAEAAREGDVL